MWCLLEAKKKLKPFLAPPRKQARSQLHSWSALNENIVWEETAKCRWPSKTKKEGWNPTNQSAPPVFRFLSKLYFKGQESLSPVV